MHKVVTTDAELVQRVTLDEKIAIDDKIRRQSIPKTPSGLLTTQARDRIQALRDEYCELEEAIGSEVGDDLYVWIRDIWAAAIKAVIQDTRQSGRLPPEPALTSEQTAIVNGLLGEW